MFWGDILYDTAVVRRKDSITIGPEPKNDFIVDLGRTFPARRWDMVTLTSDGSAELRLTEEIEGHVRFDKEIIPIRKLTKSDRVSPGADGFLTLKLTPSDRAELGLGHVTFNLDWITGGEKIPVAPLMERKKALITALLGSFLLSLLLMMRLWIPEPPPPEKPPERLVELIKRSAPAPVVKPTEVAPAKAAVGQKKTADGGAQKEEIGKAQLAPPKPPEPADKLKSANLGNLVKGLSALGAKAPGKNAGPKSDSGFPSALSQTGTGGFSTEGLKTGGGRKTVGIGINVGQSEDGFEGTGRLGLSGESKVEGGTGHGSNGGTITDGGLDRDVIDSIVRRRQDRIRLCYERQLNFSPGLAGKVTVKFTIGKAGEVVKSLLTEDTMKNRTVASCILNEVQSWTFPKPRGGTLVTVDYPFVFEAGGGR